MHRNERNRFIRLLGAIHSTTDTPELSSAWRDDVMNEIARSGRFTAAQPDWERLAPRFTMAAATLSVIMAITAGWSLNTLPTMLYQAYASELYSIVPSTIMSL